MCGLFGWVGAFRAKERVRLSGTLAALNVTRGNQSWGASVQSVGNWIRLRGLGPATDGVESFSRFSAVMGHTRLATHGAVSLDNCHPFQHGKIQLAHNGVVFNALEQPDAKGMVVDSQLLARRVAEKRDISDLSGYGVVTWTDVRRPGRVYLCNIGSGDLSIFSVKDKDKARTRGVVWSSEEKHAKIALDAAHLDFTEYEVEDGVVYLAQQSGLYRTERRLSWTTRKYSYSWSSSATGGKGARWNGRKLVTDEDAWEYRSWGGQHGTFGHSKQTDLFAGSPNDQDEKPTTESEDAEDARLQEWLLARSLEKQEEERDDLLKAGLSAEDLAVLENDAAFWENIE